VAVIKANNVGGSGAAPFSMSDIEEQARALLVRARQESERLIAAARVQADHIKRVAHAEGIVAGRKEGLEKGHAEGLKNGHEQALAEHRAALTQVVAALTAATGALEAARGELEAVALREVAELAVAVGRRVTKRQAAVEPDVLSANLVEAMKLVVHTADVRIAVNPAQKATLQDSLPRLRLQWPQLAHVELVEDRNLAPGGCRIFTAHGEINADIDAQLDRVIADVIPPEARA
jgi:flagellar assembly protein FliH